MKQWELRGVTIERARTRRPVDVRIPEAAGALRALVAQLPALVWTTDRRLLFTSSRGSASAVARLGGDELLGRSVREIFGLDRSGSGPMEAHARALAGETVSFEVARDGRRFGGRVAPLIDGGGRCIGTIAVAVDLTGHESVRRLTEPRRLTAVG